MEDYVCSSWMIGLVLLLCVLHGCFAAAIAAMETLGSSLKGMAEQNPKLQYYAKQKRKLRRTAAAERMLFDVCVTAWLYSAFWFNWRKELGALPAGWRFCAAGAFAVSWPGQWHWTQKSGVCCCEASGLRTGSDGVADAALGNLFRRRTSCWWHMGEARCRDRRRHHSNGRRGQ